MGPELGRRLDRRPDLTFRQLTRPRVGAAGQDGTGRDDLDEVGATGQESMDGEPDVGLVADLTDPQILGQLDPGPEPGHRAAATDRRHVPAGALHPRPRGPAALDRVAQRAVDERPIGPDVADGGEAAAEGRVGIPDARHRLLGGTRGRGGDPRDLELADQVRMAIDEARHGGQTAEVDRGHAIRRCRPHGGDPVALEDKVAAVEHLARLDIEQSPDADDGGRGGRGHRASLVARLRLVGGWPRLVGCWPRLVGGCWPRLAHSPPLAAAELDERSQANGGERRPLLTAMPHHSISPGRDAHQRMWSDPRH